MAEAIIGRTISINWLPGTFNFNQRGRRGKAPRDRKGIYIIEKNESPIYVGKGIGRTGVGGRAYEHYRNSFIRLRIPPHLAHDYKVKIGIINNSSIAEDAEKIVTRTLIKEPHKFALTNSGNEIHPLTIVGTVTLRLMQPPRYLREKLDLLSRIPGNQITRDNRLSELGTYRLTTETGKYESFTDNLMYAV